MINPTGGSSFNPYASPSAVQPQGADGSGGLFSSGGSDSFASSQNQPQQEQGAVSGLMHGMYNGVAQAVKTAFSPQGLLMMAGCAGLLLATGGAAAPFLTAAGVGIGAMQVGQGLIKGDWEKVGEGAIMLAPLAFTKMDSPVVLHAASKEQFAVSVGQGGYSAASKITPNALDYLKLLVGKKMPGSNGGQKSIYGLMWDNAMRPKETVKTTAQQTATGLKGTARDFFQRNGEKAAGMA